MNLIESIIDFVAPVRCLGCGTDGWVVCSLCTVKHLNKNIILPDRKSGRRCAACAYEGLAAKVVIALKYDRLNSAAKLMAQIIDQSLPNNTWDIICHIPTANKRVRKRGYDQSWLIAKHLAQIRGVKASRLLIRTSSARQVGNDRKTREKQLKGAFMASKHLAGQNILLVDDVMTTGSTIDEATKTLMKAGAKRVDSVVFAATEL